MAAKKTKKDYYFAIGRRRTASARVRLHKGNKENLVNDVLVGKYFPGAALKTLWQKPFVLTSTLGKFYFTAKVAGGGKNGQLEAVTLGVSRALVLANSKNHRASLKAAGLLSRDSRKKERRKVGTGGKARKQKQSPKR